MYSSMVAIRENARLSFLATAAIIGGRTLYQTDHKGRLHDSLSTFASRQLSWVLGCNP